jgi:hypothetical protein
MNIGGRCGKRVLQMSCRRKIFAVDGQDRVGRTHHMIAVSD